MEARLRPLTVPGEQVCREYAITTDPPVPVFGYDQLHQMGLVNHFVLRGDPHQFLAIQAESTVETLRDNPFEGLDLLAEDWPMLSDHALHERFAEFLAPTPLVPLYGTWSGPEPLPGVLAYAQALSDAIYTQFEYVPGSTDITTPLAEFVAGRRGVCQDYAHLMLAAARSRGVPARYVSGYIYAGADDGTNGAGLRDSCLGRAVPAPRPGVEGLRPDQQHPRRRPPHQGRRGPRLRRRAADQGPRPGSPRERPPVGDGVEG